MKKTSVLFTIGEYGTGGKEKQLGELIKNISKNRYDIFLLYSNGNSHFFKALDKHTKECKNINRYNFISFFKYAHKIKPDIIYCWSRPTAYYSLLYKIILNRKILLINGSIQSAPLKKSLVNLIDCHIYNLYKFVVSNSKAGLCSFKQNGKPGRFTLYNSIKAVNIKNKIKLRSKFSFRNEAFIVSMVAGLKKTKDHSTLLKAAKICSENDDSIIFYLIGDGNKRQYILNKINKLKLKNVILLGNRTDVMEILNACDLSVLCSTNGEGISNALLESLILGVPVIATEGGGTREILKHGVNGYMIRRKDHYELAKRIIYLKNNKEAMKKLSSNAGLVKEKFSIKKMTDTFDNIVRKCYEMSK